MTVIMHHHHYIYCPQSLPGLTNWTNLTHALRATEAWLLAGMTKRPILGCHSGVRALAVRLGPTQLGLHSPVHLGE